MSGTGASTTYREQVRLVRTKAMRVWVVVLVLGLIYLPWVVDQRSLLGIELTKHQMLNMDMTQLNTMLINRNPAQSPLDTTALRPLTDFVGR